MIGFIYALISSVFVSVANVSAKEALRREHSIEFSTFASILAFFLILPFIPWVNFQLSSYYMLLIYFAALSSAFGFFFMARSLRHRSVLKPSSTF